MVENGIALASEMIASSGGAPVTFDAIDRANMVKKMYDVCECSGEEMDAIDKFLQSEEYKLYVDSVSKMTKVIFDETSKSLAGLTKH